MPWLVICRRLRHNDARDGHTRRFLAADDRAGFGYADRISEPDKESFFRRPVAHREDRLFSANAVREIVNRAFLILLHAAEIECGAR